MAQIQSGVDNTLLTVDSATKAALVKQVGTATVNFEGDDFTKDSFERLRVSEPRIMFEFCFNAAAPATATTIWEATAYGAGTAALTTNLYGTDLNTTTATNTGYWIQSYNHIRYAPGVSTLHRFTFCFNQLITNITQRVGMFTDQGTFPSIQGDGVFIEANGSAISFVRRSLATGAGGSEERIVQANWNMDKMDGTGASGVNLDWTKAQHLVIEFQWLGVGTIRFGFETGHSGIVWAHQIASVNNLSTAWSRTGSFPVRAECFSTGTVSVAGRLTLINCVVIQEGDVAQIRGWRYFSGNSGSTVKTTGTANGLYPVMSLRAASTNDLTKRNRIRPQSLTITVTTASTGATALQAALLMLPTPNTGATFSATVGGSLTTIDQAATATTAVTGSAIWSATLPNAVGSYTFDLSNVDDNANVIGYNAAGTVAITGPSVLTLAVGPLAGTATVAPSVCASINWKEVY